MREQQPPTTNNNKKLSPFSGDYERNRKEVRGDLITEDIFGLEEIFGVLLDNNRVPEVDIPNEDAYGITRFIDSLLEDTTLHKLPGMADVVSRLRNTLVEKMQNPRSQHAVDGFISESYIHPYVNKRIFFFQKGANTLRIEDTPDELLLQMILLHLSNFIKKIEAFKNREAKLRKNFLKKINQLIQQGVFEADFPSIVARANIFAVTHKDTLVRDLTESWGEADIANHHISISGQVDDTREEEVYEHEMLHAVSGVTLFLQESSSTVAGDGLVKSEGEVGVARVGVGTGKTIWLNEAVTQSLTALLLSGKLSDAYKDEIALFEELIRRSKGQLTKKLFFDFYFKHTTTSDAVEYIRDFELTELSGIIDRAFNTTNFLYRLGARIKENGAQNTLKLLKQSSSPFLDII